MLHGIDDALVPALQRGARAVGRGLGLPVRALRWLDDRVAGGRPARAVHQHRSLVALLIVAVGFGSALVHFDRYPDLRARAQQAAASSEDDDRTEGAPVAGASAAFGPLVGARVEPYLEARGSALDAAPADDVRVAVVSFDEFVTAATAARAVASLDAIAVQYRLPERTPRPDRIEVDEALEATMDDLIEDMLADLRQEQRDTESTIATTEDEGFRTDYEARLDELVALRNTLVDDPRIVFAVVVRGPVRDLRAVAAIEGVRLVDLVSADVAEATAARAHGILPTDRDRFTHGRTS